MRFIFLLLFLSVSSFSQKKINGISLVASNNDINASVSNAIVAVNANWITLMPFAFMKTEYDTSIVFNSKYQWLGERKEGIANTASFLKKSNFKLMLKPQIWIPNCGFTGHIKMKNEEDWKLLEKNYTNFILFYANVAKESNFEMFCIGTELNIFVTQRPLFWYKLIFKIKEIYKGKITYAENWDTYDKVPFISKLDYIGVDEYFPLNNNETPTIKALKIAWKKIAINLESLSQNHKKQILFTEFGYQSKSFTAKEPWDFSKKYSVNFEAQNNCLKSIFDSFWKEKWFAGGFLWKWYDNHEKAGGKNDTDYTVQNKPAENIVKLQYLKK